MLGIFIAFPWLALVAAIIFAILYRISKNRLSKIAGKAWLIYSIYEFGMYFRILCTGECNIRIDLLLIYPVLLIFSFIALVKGLLAMRAQRKMQS